MLKENISNFNLYYSLLISNLRNISKKSFAKATYYLLYYFIVVVLLFSGITKIIDPSPSIEVLKTALNLPDAYNLIIMTLLPVVEITLAILMLTKFQQKIVQLIVAFLFFCFLSFAIYGTIIGLDKDCGCFGKYVVSQFGVWMIVRNIFFFVTTCFLLLKGKDKFLSN